MAFTDSLFLLGMAETLHFRRDKMGLTKDLNNEIVDLVRDAIEKGATNPSDVYGYVTQYVPHDMVSMSLVETIVRQDMDNEEERLWDYGT